jgi:uncharacterized membrane protein YoaK (UPF0700 family)
MTALRVGRPGNDVGGVGVQTMTFTLSFIAGLVDVTSFILLNGLFAAHVTGNIVVMAADVALDRPVRLATALAVGVFIAVTAAFTAAVDISRREPYRWTQPFLWLQFALLTATAVAAPVLGRMAWDRAGVEILLAVLAVAAMACQNALLHLTFRRAPSTAVMTGNIVAATVALVGLALDGSRRRRGAPGSGGWADGTVGEHVRTPSTDRDRTDWHALWPLLLGFTVGCLSGALASKSVTWWAWIGPALVSGLLAVRVTKAGVPLQLRRDRSAALRAVVNRR